MTTSRQEPAKCAWIWAEWIYIVRVAQFVLKIARFSHIIIARGSLALGSPPPIIATEKKYRQVLSKRQLCREANNAPESGVNLRRSFAFARTPSFFPRVITWLEPRIQSKNQYITGERSTSKNHLTLLSSRPEPKIWSRDTGQRRVKPQINSIRFGGDIVVARFAKYSLS